MNRLRVVTPEEWHRTAADENVLLVDLRSPEDYRQYHIEGAINIPYEQIRKIAPFRRKKLVLYCDTGATSAAAGIMLAQHGYQVFTLRGGIRAYLKTYPDHTTGKKRK